MIKLILYHYSNTDIKGYIKPDFYGINNYTVFSVYKSAIKRSYFYLEDKPQEKIFITSKFLYTAEVLQDKIYNIIEDKLNLQEKLNTFTDILQEVKKRGYIGILGNVNGKYNIISLFKPIKIKSKINLTK